MAAVAPARASERSFKLGSDQTASLSCTSPLVSRSLLISAATRMSGAELSQRTTDRPHDHRRRLVAGREENVNDTYL
jgi:hypothetical protein